MDVGVRKIVHIVARRKYLLSIGFALFSGRTVSEYGVVSYYLSSFIK